ncbi:MAG: hypothetical protein R2706_10040 [Acidimicrobiales bacterium]
MHFSSSPCAWSASPSQATSPISLVFWLAAAVGGAAVDVLGNIPFMRMVKPRERTAADHGVFHLARGLVSRGAAPCRRRFEARPVLVLYLTTLRCW